MKIKGKIGTTKKRDNGHGQHSDGVHVVRTRHDYVEYPSLGVGVVYHGPGNSTPSPEEAGPARGLVRCYMRNQQTAEGPYVDRPFYEDYLQKGKYF